MYTAKKNAKWFTKTFHEKTRIVLKKITTVTTMETQIVETLDSTFEKKTKVENNKEAYYQNKEMLLYSDRKG